MLQLRPQCSTGHIVKLGGSSLRRCPSRQLTESGFSLSRRLTLSQTIIQYRQARGIQTKPFYITTPIFYVNANPHVGHLYTMVLTDVMKRYRLFTGREAVLLTGTDEHGLKIQNAAQKANLSAQEFCDGVSKVFRDLPQKANVANDIFMRTSSSEHKAAVTQFWSVLNEKGYIYKATHEGWYSTSDETFFPESAIEQRGETYHSVETGNIVSWTQEENYHFRLSAFKDRLLQFYSQNPGFIVPQARFDDVVTSVSSDLADLSISRPVERLSWGIPVPGDETQTIYVWLDALINYITAAGYPATMNLWPADVHVIGKDIVRFHCVYWPAFLMAAGMDLPKKVVTHAHWTMGRLKMSKSAGNVADPWTAIDRFGIDSVRYYLMADGRLENDTDYSNEHLIGRHNSELVHALGNLLARSTAPAFDSQAFVADAPDLNKLGATSKQLQERTIEAVKLYHEHMNEFIMHKSIAAVIDLIRDAQAFVQVAEPWSKNCDSEKRKRVIYCCLEVVRVSVLLLQPIMPGSMGQMLDRLGVDSARRTAEYAHFGKDNTYKPLPAVKGEHTFKLIETEEKLVQSALRNLPVLENYKSRPRSPRRR